jgi:hypothetical protein
MAKFSSSEYSLLTPAEVKRLEATFNKFQKKMEKLRSLEKKVIEADKVIQRYLNRLSDLGGEFEDEFGNYSDQFEIDGNEVYFGELNEATVANAFNFWIPSNMSC